MIVYLDTSAVIPILIDEPSTEVCRRAWNAANRRASSRLTYVEVATALAMAERRRRLTSRQHATAWSHFNRLWPDVDIVELDASLAARAASFAKPLALRGDDAVHCACAEALREPQLVAVSGDVGLLDAWQRLGLAVLDTNR
ncbi:type II toxin-antitoxin system VapC family toxin [Calidifontibacter sp. DB0510]|uniref:Ribonuclease VapC n=1 Tax=Metallococcus carri TaxID=1656884 RepID=A0A967AXX1_9MICO|nr:type II toxin-antitoxin system VapC family toxin [Metallococcus carri]NHN54773.1 type II toxin-antitoxin system VapC family toxin [Metallococcus carri]NOP37118.1 type II toxin-antitoxin system VapC family toxin [Calidifontibacter sp. DB2511S]